MATFFTEADVTGTGETVEAEAWLATEFTVPAGTLNALRWRFPAGALSVTPLMRIFNAGGTAQVIGNAGATSLAFDTSTADQFNAATLPTPISLSAGTYRAVVNTTRYVFRTGFWSGGSIVRGDITGVQSRFGSPGSAPASTSTATYFVDIDFSASSSPVAPASLAVAVGLGAPTVGYSISAAPNGLSVPVGLGAPAVPSTGITVTPTALSVPAGLGAPSVVYSPTPSPLAVSIGLGAPEIGQATGSAGWSDFGGIIQGAINDARINADRRRNPIECPEHGWPLQITPRGRHCQFGGHVVTGEW